MAQELDFEKAKELIDGGVSQAQELMNDPAKVDELLQRVQDEIAKLPDTFQNAAANVPLMIDMVKGYITKEYTEVSPKVIASLVAAFIYFVNAKDLIPDKIPLLGLADDLAVATAAMKLCEPELAAFATWKEANKPLDLEA